MAKKPQRKVIRYYIGFYRNDDERYYERTVSEDPKDVSWDWWVCMDGTDSTEAEALSFDLLVLYDGGDTRLAINAFARRYGLERYRIGL